MLWLRLEVVAGAGLVEAFVGEWEVGDDGVRHCHGQCRPVEQRWVNEFGVGDAFGRVDFDAVHDGAAPAFDYADAARVRTGRVGPGSVFDWAAV